MGFFSNRYECEGAGLPMPEGGIRRYLLLLVTHFWKLIGLNLLFAFFSLPVITFPAALCAMNRVCMLLIRNGYCFLWHDFIEEFRRSFVRSLLPAVFFPLLVFFGYYAMSLGLTNAELPLWSMIFWAIGIGGTVVAVCWGEYFFALVALLDLGNKGVLKNAWLLCMIQPQKAFLILGIVMVAAMVTALLIPISILLIICLLPVLVQYSVCFFVHEAATAYVILPYEDNASNK
nr:DUF624 domain-containing protein [Oscillospiraceae bacterium]